MMMIAKSLLKGTERPDFIKHETIADIFRTSASQYAHNTALIFGDRKLNYTQLDSWSNYIAAFIA